MNLMVDQIKDRLKIIISEIQNQSHIGELFSNDGLSFSDLIDQLYEYVDCNEQGIAYETVVVYLEECPFVLSGRTSVALLELGLLFGFRTERPEDLKFKRIEN
jgi:hypothetical protein